MPQPSNSSQPAAPPAIEPDTKNWTWVLDEQCPECGFDARDLDVRSIGEGIRANASQWLEILDRNDADLRTRPSPEIWSALEYAAHVSDVFNIFDQRLERMLSEDGPHYENWDQDVSAVEQRYDLADPRGVARSLARRADTVATRFASVSGDEWERPGFRSDGSAFTVESFARYFMHDPVHHLYDVDQVFADLAR